MKIKRFNRETNPIREMTKPGIRIMKRGYIGFNQAAMAVLNINIGDGVEFIQDEEKPKDWFICRSKSESAFKLRADKSSARIASQTIALSILRSIETDATSIFLIISKTSVKNDDEELWPIITSSHKLYSKRHDN